MYSNKLINEKRDHQIYAPETNFTGTCIYSFITYKDMHTHI